MAFETGSFDTTLAAAAGDDPGLLIELRHGYGLSVAHQLDLLVRSRCDANWAMAAARMRSLAAGFHDTALMDLAEMALAAAPGEPTIIDAIADHLDRLGHLPAE